MPRCTPSVSSRSAQPWKSCRVPPPELASKTDPQHHRGDGGRSPDPGASRWSGGKSGHHKAARPAQAGGIGTQGPVHGKCHREQTARSRPERRRGRVRVKRRGKSSPAREQSRARDKPRAVQDKTGSPARLAGPPRKGLSASGYWSHPGLRAGVVRASGRRQMIATPLFGAGHKIRLTTVANGRADGNPSALSLTAVC